MITPEEVSEILEKYKNYLIVCKYRNQNKVMVWPKNIKSDYCLFHCSSTDNPAYFCVWSYTCFASFYFPKNDVFTVNLYNIQKIESKSELISIIEKFIIFEKCYLSSMKQFKSELLKQNITKDFE